MEKVMLQKQDNLKISVALRIHVSQQKSPAGQRGGGWEGGGRLGRASPCQKTPHLVAVPSGTCLCRTRRTRMYPGSSHQSPLLYLSLMRTDRETLSNCKGAEKCGLSSTSDRKVTVFWWVLFPPHCQQLLCRCLDHSLSRVENYRSSTHYMQALFWNDTQQWHTELTQGLSSTERLCHPEKTVNCTFVLLTRM